MGANKAAMAKAIITDDDWNGKLRIWFENVKHVIANRVSQRHIDETKHFCLHTDCSDSYHAAVLGQILL